MKIRIYLGLLMILLAGFCADANASSSATQPAVSPKKVLILTGMEYPGHLWKLTAPLLSDIISKDPRLTVTICKDPTFLASPKLAEYDVIVLNYMNWKTPDPGEAARAGLQKFVDSGGGLVLVHFACGAFQEWPEFKSIAGRIWDPKLPPHDARGPFHVEIVAKAHPICDGLSDFDTDDELYTCLAGDCPVEVLAQAKSKVDGKEHPMALVHTYGKGRVFECTLGHDVKALNIAGEQELYRRGTLWVAGLLITHTQ